MPCAKAVPHLNELYAKFKDQGLVIVGVSNESKSEIETSNEKVKKDFVLARIKGEDTDRAYGVKGFPSSCLVDAEGRVVWSGHPNELDEKVLTDLLAKSLVVPALPDAFKDINKLIASRKWGKAYDSIGKALAAKADDKDLQKGKADIESVVKRRTEEAKTALDAGEFGKAWDLYEEVAEVFSGMSAAIEAKAALETLRKNPAAKDELGAHAQVKKAEEQLAKGDADKAVATWKALIKKFPNTPSAKIAQVALRQRGM